LPYWKNAYTGDEFLTSTDERFRPVDAMVAPDGSLFICDMYRGIIQHKTYLTEYLAGEIRSRNLEQPIGLGRIYRITHDETDHTPSFAAMSKMSDSELVQALAAADQFTRLAAQRLLVERQATGAADEIRLLLQMSDRPLARVHALWTLDGLQEASTDDVLVALADQDARVQSAACRVAESHDPHAVLESLIAAANANERLVRFQATLSLGALQTEAAREALTVIAQTNASDSFVRSAVISGLQDHEVEVLRALLADGAWPKNAADRAMFAELVDASLRSKQSSQLLAVAVQQTSTNPARAEIIFARLGAMQRLGSNNPRRLTIAAEPAGWAMFLASGSGRLADAARQSDAHLVWPGRPAPEAIALTTDERVQIARGKSLFVYCQGCHGADGMGSGSQYPPLVGSPRVLGPPEDLARVLIHGFEGPLVRDGVRYNEAMPPSPFGDDRDLAAIMTYVRNAWGNEADSVSSETVAKVRRDHASQRRPWRAEDFDE